jgi:hypothetical protein
MNKIDHRLLLLKIIRFNGNVQPLIELGHNFADVIDAIKEEQSLGNVDWVNGKISMTDKGLEEIATLEKKVGRKFPWIEPETESKIKKLGEDEIYIPSRDSIQYLFGNK